MEKNYFDYLIIGQGLAGSSLSYYLHNAGKSVLVVDDSNGPSSSQMAPGLINPVVFKRLTSSWRVDELLPAAQAFYRENENLLGRGFFYPKNIFKVFTSVADQNNWLMKSDSPGVGKYLSLDSPEVSYDKQLTAPFGGGMVLDSGYVDVPSYLINYRAWLNKQEMLATGLFDYRAVEMEENSVIWNAPSGTVRAGKIICCEGTGALKNPWFNWLPFVPAKGEVLTIKAKGLPSDHIITKNFYILPVGSNIFRVGATYVWDDLSLSITEKGKNELSAKLNSLLKIPFEIIHQQAGIRPAVKDRRPLIGIHPENKNIGIFNGLGTKGVMIAPFFARLLAQHLEEETPIEKQVNIERFLNKQQ